MCPFPVPAFEILPAPDRSAAQSAVALFSRGSTATQSAPLIVRSGIPLPEAHCELQKLLAASFRLSSNNHARRNALLARRRPSRHASRGQQREGPDIDFGCPSPTQGRNYAPRKDRPEQHRVTFVQSA